MSNTATESVTVNDVPAIVTNGALTTNAGVVGNASLAATLGYTGQTLTFAVVVAPVHGTVTITNAATGAFTYTPTTAYAGSDSFTFKATDAYGTVSNIATESVTVSDVAATANNGTVATTPDTAIGGTLPVTLAYTGQTLTFAIVASPSHGSVSITNTATGAFTYTPTTGYTGSDTFTFKATDSYGMVSNTATETATTTGPVAALTPLPSSFGFASTLIGGVSATKVFTLKNNGNATLTSISESKAGPNPNQFTIQSTTCGSPLWPRGRAAPSAWHL